METETYSSQKIEGHARTSELIYKTGKVVAGLGLIAVLGVPITNYVEDEITPINPPERVIKAETTLNTLIKDKNELESTLENSLEKYPYTTPDIEKITKIREVNKNISEYNNEINKTKEYVSGLKETQDFGDYKKQVEIRKERQNRRAIISAIGIPVFILGFLGFFIGSYMENKDESK